MVPKALNRVPSALHNLGFRPKALTLEPLALQKDSGSSIIEPEDQSRAGDKCFPRKGRRREIVALPSYGRRLNRVLETNALHVKGGAER